MYSCHGKRGGTHKNGIIQSSGHVSKYNESCFTQLRIRNEAKGLSLEFCHLFIHMLFASITSSFTAQNAMMDGELK
jgi:hypothetical protein